MPTIKTTDANFQTDVLGSDKPVLVDFQTAEYLEDHGMIDMVIPRNQQHEKLGSILSMLMHKAET